MLGNGVCLAAPAKDPSRPSDFGIDDHGRLIALLSAAGGRVVAKSTVEKIRHACALWSQGERCLAQIHLAFLGLPRQDEAAVYCLFLADQALAKGVRPADVMKALGFDANVLNLEKYSEDQPRVPAGNGRESGQWTSGNRDGSENEPGGASRSARDKDEARQRFVQRVEIRIVGKTISDADRGEIAPGARYAQNSSPPILTPKVLKHILELHSFGTADNSKGKFTPEFSTEQAIRELIEKAWEQATPEDLGAGTHPDSVVIAGAMLMIVNGVAQPYIIGRSGEERRAPAVPTNTYVVVIGSNNQVRSCYPINPVDEINPRDE